MIFMKKVMNSGRVCLDANSDRMYLTDHSLTLVYADGNTGRGETRSRGGNADAESPLSEEEEEDEGEDPLLRMV